MLNEDPEFSGTFCSIYFAGYRDLVTHGKLLLPFEKFRHLSNDGSGKWVPTPPVDFLVYPDAIGDHLGPRRTDEATLGSQGEN